MFIEQRLLECVSYGTQGGPTFLTRRVGLRNGKTRRNPLRVRPLYKFAVVYKNLETQHHIEVRDAFNACKAGLHSFRLKDWSDYTVDDQLLPVAGNGGVQNTQLVRIYGFGTLSTLRLIRKPVDGSVTMTANGSPIASTVDPETGIATYTAPNASLVRWSGEFDVPVFFSQDDLSFEFSDKSAAGFFLTGDVMLEEDTDA